MSPITGPKVLSALMKDPEYSVYDEKTLSAMKPFMMALPEVLKENLSQPATLKSIMDAKLIFQRYLLENDYVAKIVGEDFDLMKSMLKGAIEILAKVVENIPGFLDENDVTEDQMMAHPRGVGLKPELLKKYRLGTLTIGDLLLKQPMVIVKNA